MGVSRIKALARAIGKYLASRPNYVLVGFAASIIIGRGTMLGFDLDARYHAATAAAEQSARSFAEVLAEHTARTFEAVDRTLGEVELIRRDVEAGRYATAEAVHEALRRLQKASPLLIAVGWTNAAGDVEAHSYPGALPRRNIAELPHFIAQRGNGSSASLFVAPPFRSIATATPMAASPASSPRRSTNPTSPAPIARSGSITAAPPC
jgi:hypothetical protein